MKSVVRTEGYLADLDDIFTYIAQDNEQAASDLWFYIDDQVINRGQTPIFIRFDEGGQAKACSLLYPGILVEKCHTAAWFCNYLKCRFISALMHSI